LEKLSRSLIVGGPSTLLRFGGFSVRQATQDDLLAVANVDKIAFLRDSGVSPLGTEFGEKWLRHHPEGFLIAERTGRNEIVAYGMSIQLNALNIHHDWYADTGNGTGSTHDPSGSMMYGLSLASSRPGAGQAVCLAGRLVTIRKKVKDGCLYSRIDGFSSWLDSNYPGSKPEDYVDQYVQQYVDATQCFYAGVGFAAVRPIPGYFPEDSLSLGYGVLMSWKNPHF
jgi:hypothetical protein